MRLILIGALCLSACGRGGGGSSSSGHGALLAVEFPDPSEQNAEPESQPPSNASLVQQIVLTFDAKPDPATVSISTIPIRDASGFPVLGSFAVKESQVVFTPDLPTRPIVEIAPDTYDLGGTGLKPGSTYSIQIGPRTWKFVDGVAADLLDQFTDPADARGIRILFSTTDNPAMFLTGLPLSTPRLIGSDPNDGETGISPNVFTDPEGLFPDRRSFFLSFDHPVNPASSNVSDLTFRLIDVNEHPPGFSAGLPLGIDVSILSNKVDGAIVEIIPSGILPFGHLLSLEIPTELKGISQGEDAGADVAIAAAFTIADVEPGDVRVVDRLVEDFDTTARRGSTSDIPLGQTPAEWDRLDTNLLMASAAFEGAGEVGRFIPSPPPAGETRTIILDTSHQVFPLFDGSTPDAPVGFEVNGGVFPFTDIEIPVGIVIKPRGPNPLVFLATGAVHIAGRIELNGINGIDENSYDSAVASTPGGAGGSGGGRGGVGHPIVFWPPDQVSVLFMVSPLRGGRGEGPPSFGQVGGVGGETGILDSNPLNRDFELATRCDELLNEHGNGGRPTGGGGGSLLRAGGKGFDGIGNVRPDGKGGFIIPEDENPKDEFFGGSGGDPPFSDSDLDNDFIGINGEQKTLFGGQGGGGGGTRMESYYCGNHCLYNSERGDDSLCMGGEFPVGAPDQQTFAASVGDAKGGGAGGGGGAFAVRALGPIIVHASAVITARGGNGGGGEALGCSNWGGSAGGGSGGAIVLESADSILVETDSLIDVGGGRGKRAVENDLYWVSCNPGDGNPGQGGNGGAGIIQLQVPFGSLANVETKDSLNPKNSWVDQQNLQNPASFTTQSVALSAWFDLGRMIAREPLGSYPAFRFLMAGEEVGFFDDGFVKTADGYVIDPQHTDIVCDYLGQYDENGLPLDGQEPKSDYIPTNATVQVEFQGADAMVPGSKEVDPETMTGWSPTPAIAQGHQFFRYRITFDIGADGAQLSSTLPRPAVQAITIDAEY